MMSNKLLNHKQRREHTQKKKCGAASRCNQAIDTRLKIVYQLKCRVPMEFDLRCFH